MKYKKEKKLLNKRKDILDKENNDYYNDKLSIEKKIEKFVINEEKSRLKNLKNFINQIKNNIKYLNKISLKLEEINIKQIFEEFQDSVEKSIFTIQKLREYINEKYFNPDIDYKYVNVPIKAKNISKEIILVLSGGGARGAAHIGVIKRLEEFNIKPVAIIGTSVGAMVGGMYAYGYSADEIYEILKKENKNFIKLGYLFFIKPKKATNILKHILLKYLNHEKIENLKIPLYLNTTNITSCKREIFDKGNLVDVILASASIPFVLDSININGSIYMDGGVCDNFCIDLAKMINKNKYLDIVISDVSAATDYTSDIIVSNFFFKLSQDFVDIVKKIGNEPFPVRSKKDLLSISNNLLYLLKQRGTIGPEFLDGTEIIVTPLLEKMGIQEFDKCLWAYEKGYETAKSVLI